MPLVTSKELLIKAQKEGYAVGAFNANNLEYIQAIVESATEEKAPVILQVSQGAIKYAGLEFVTEIVKIAAEQAPIPVVLHLDHGTSFEQNVQCLRAGFTSLMYDGSLEPLEKNITITSKICEIAHSVGIPLEAELGRVAGSEEGHNEAEIEELKTNPAQAREFVEKTGCDSLAIAIGSVHRMQTKEASLDIERLKKIRRTIDTPLVLHGGSGVSEKSIRDGIKNGLAKINVATQLNMAFSNGVKEGLKKYPDEVDPRKFLTEAKKAVKEIVRYHIRLFECNGKG
ncbi:MAG: class II fructose-bisphosphate aldolase [Candidatus Edwardsbacteria bacterium]